VGSMDNVPESKAFNRMQSAGGTLAYRFAGVRTIGLDCPPAGWSSLTPRLLFGALGPLGQHSPTKIHLARTIEELGS